MWVDAGQPPKMVLLGETAPDLKVTLFARLPINLDDWDRLGEQDLPRNLALLVGDEAAWQADTSAK